MTANRRISAASIIGNTVVREKWLSIGIILTVTGAVVISLLPPLVLGKIIDRIAGGNFPGFSMAAEYFLLIFLSGALESLRESFLTVFGQKMTHAFRSELSKKLVRLSTDTLNKEEPGAVVSRFVGDVDTVEALFTSGIISMFADACRVISIFAVIWFQNRGLALLDSGDLCVHENRPEADADGAVRESRGNEPCHKSCSGDNPVYQNDSYTWKRDVYGEKV